MVIIIIMIIKMIRYTTIPLFPKTKERLKKHGKKGETWDQVVNKIIDVFEEEKRV